MRPVAREDAFMRFKRRNPAPLIQIFKDIIDGPILQAIYRNFMPVYDNKYVGIQVGTRASSNPSKPRLPIFYTPTIEDVWQKLAIEIRITGLQKQANEAHGSGALLKDDVTEAIKCLKTTTRRPFIDKHKYTILNTRAIFNANVVELLCKNFGGMVAAFGESVAGDEKLYHFTGDHGTVRLVVSKPDKVGQWMYQLCCKTETGQPYLLHTKMHDNSDGKAISIASIVQEWIDAIKLVAVEGEALPMLVGDSYYLGAESRGVLTSEEMPCSFCCKKDRVAVEWATLEHLYREKTGDSSLTVKPGKHWAMYNTKTHAVFCVHHDTQKGLGVKYNLSHGLVRSTNLHVVRRNKDVIPGYSYYKCMFEVCDRFNRNLHDRTYPKARGGNGTSGAYLNAHDFYMACILQNVFTVYDHLREVHDRPLCDWTWGKDHPPHVVDQQRTKSFCDKCIELSNAMAECGATGAIMNVEMERVGAAGRFVDPLSRPAWMPVTAAANAEEYNAAVSSSSSSSSVAAPVFASSSAAAAGSASSSSCAAEPFAEYPPAAAVDVSVDDADVDLTAECQVSIAAPEPAAAQSAPAAGGSRKRRTNQMLAEVQTGLTYPGYGSQR